MPKKTKWEDWIYEFGKAYRGELDLVDHQVLKVARWLHRLQYSPQFAAETFDKKYNEFYSLTVRTSAPTSSAK